MLIVIVVPNKWNEQNDNNNKSSKHFNLFVCVWVSRSHVRKHTNEWRVKLCIRAQRCAYEIRTLHALTDENCVKYSIQILVTLDFFSITILKIHRKVLNNENKQKCYKKNIFLTHFSIIYYCLSQKMLINLSIKCKHQIVILIPRSIANIYI